MIQLAAFLVLAPQSAPMFPFVIPWDDSVAGTATDVSFLNDAPAGKNGRIVVRDGRFVQEKTGKRIRFFGTNITARSAFPTQEDADKIAARLAKLGVNIVRFHHLQNDWDLNGGTIWNEARMHREVDPKQLDKLDYFVAALKKRGIYTNLNLQTTRKYFPDMGFPESVLQIPTEFDKKIDKIDRRMIALQKEYARTLLGHKNPYTGLMYKDEPALAVVEINNENSLVGWPGEGPGNGLGQMPEPFRGEIVSAWNAWLHKKYATKADLEKSWTTGVTPTGPSIVDSHNSWVIENQSNGDVRPLITNVRHDYGPGRTPPLSLDIRSNSGPDWHVQAHFVGLNLKNGDTYTVSFTVQSSQENTIRISANLDQNDWRNLGLDRALKIGPKMMYHAFSFTVSGAEPDHGRISFVLGAARGTVTIDDVYLRPGVPDTAGTALGFETSSIDLPESGTKRLMADYTDFLADAETAYSTEMRNFLRKDLGIKANLIDTQISWGGLTSLQREKESDFADNHAYFQHPSFAKAWDAVEWTMPNTPMVAEFKNGRLGELSNLAVYRVAGKPYTISEYNHPAPNDYRAEMLPEVMSFAALQDWDIVYTFDYASTGKGRLNDAIQGFFATGTDPAKAAFFPSSALIFRAGGVPILPSADVRSLPGSRPWQDAFTPWGMWDHGKMPDLLKTRIGIQAGGPIEIRPMKTEPASASTAQTPAPLYQVDARSAKIAVGYVGGRKVSLGGLDLSFGKFGNGFASVTAVARDLRPLSTSKRTLFTLVGKVENQGMVWKDASRTSVGDKWGHGPTVAEGIPCAVTMRTDGPRKVWALDGNGRRVRPVPSRYESGKLTFEVGPEYRTLWYEVARP